MTNRYLIDFYRHYDEDGRLASRHGSVEFLTTMHYIEKYLRPGFRILEIAAEPGVIPMRLQGAAMRCRRWSWWNTTSKC